MAELTPEQRLFLKRHKISVSAIFDATGMSKSQYQDAMRAEDKYFAIGVTACRKEGHTLRIRSGHCVQCDTSDIAYFFRHYANAYVYIAASRKKSLTKIGFSTDPADRMRTVNCFSYGGADDWGVISQLKCKNAGSIEFDVHEKLSPFSSPQSYYRSGVKTNCLETFACGYPIARQALKNVVGDNEMKNIFERKDAFLNYNF